MTDPVEKPAEVPAVTANDNAPQSAAPAARTISKKSKILSGLFNMAAGAGLTMLAKAGIASAMITCPPFAILLASSFAVGAIMTALCHEGKRRHAKKAGEAAPAFLSKQNLKGLFSRQNAKVFIKSGLFAFIGGAIALGFQEGVFQDAFHKIFGSTPAVAAPDVTAVTAPPVVDVAPPCPTPGENFATLIEGHDVSSRVQDAMQRAASTDPRIAAQGVKDLAYFSFNGFDGVPKDPHVSLELFKQAADAGNVQAKIDLLYLQHHGLGDVTANPVAALNGMQQIDTPRADWFVERWSPHIGDTGAPQPFNSDAILKGVKFCPAA